MALSEQERKLLEQLEASLVAEDPKLAETLRGTHEIKIHRKRATLAGVGFVLGLVVLVAGVQINPLLSILGFLLMLGSAIVGVSSWQRVAGDDGGEPVTSTSQDPENPKSPSQDFMDRLNERWRNRHDGGDV